MANYISSSGNIDVKLPENIEITHLAGKLSADQVRRMIKPRGPNVGGLCEQLADIIDASPDFMAPEGIAAQLRDAGAKSAGIKPLVFELKSLLKEFQQQNLLYDSASYALVRQVNDLVNAQSKYSPELEERFFPLIYFFNKKRKPNRLILPEPDTADDVDAANDANNSSVNNNNVNNGGVNDTEGKSSQS